MDNEQAFLKQLQDKFQIEKQYQVKIDVVKYKGIEKRSLYIDTGSLPHDIAIEVLKGVVESYEKGKMLR